MFNFVFDFQDGVQPRSNDDKVAEVLVPLQENVKLELEKSAKEVDRARRAQAKVSLSSIQRNRLVGT